MESSSDEITTVETCESGKLEQLLKKTRVTGWLIIILIILVLPVILYGLDVSMRKSSFEYKALRSLRALGVAELTYASCNNEKWHGTFEALKDTGFIDEDTDFDNLIPNYKVNWIFKKEEHFSGFCSTGGPFYKTSFTIVAYPDRRYPPGLRTFGITDDTLTRVYSPYSQIKEGTSEESDWVIVDPPPPNRFDEMMEKLRDFLGM